MKRILFVCKYNLFRSKVAESYFNKKNKNKGLKATSVGIKKAKRALNSKDLSFNIAKKCNITIKGKPKIITNNLLNKQDMVVIVADGIPEMIKKLKAYKGEKIIWQIKDEKKGNPDNIRRIIKQIKVKVKNLIDEQK